MTTRWEEIDRGVRGEESQYVSYAEWEANESADDLAIEDLIIRVNDLDFRIGVLTGDLDKELFEEFSVIKADIKNLKEAVRSMQIQLAIALTRGYGQERVTHTAHGFSEWDAVGFDVVTEQYVLAQNLAGEPEALGVLVDVTTNKYTVIYGGRHRRTSHGKALGAWYLSPTTPGLLTQVKPNFPASRAVILYVNNTHWIVVPEQGFGIISQTP